MLIGHWFVGYRNTVCVKQLSCKLKTKGKINKDKHAFDRVFFVPHLSILKLVLHNTLLRMLSLLYWSISGQDAKPSAETMP